MIDHELAQLALRTQLLTLATPTTGSTSLSATSTGYARAAGSFLTDGFRVGMEITAASGFTVAGNNISNAQGRVITALDATSISCTGCATEVAASGKTLTVGVPFKRGWENLDLTPPEGYPFIDEDYLPGPAAQIAMGALGDMEVFPTYVLKLYGLANTGPEALRRYAHNLLTLFAPRTAISVSGSSLMVRTDPAPYCGQILNLPSRRAVITITIPLRGHSPNVS